MIRNARAALDVDNQCKDVVSFFQSGARLPGAAGCRE
jgi:hypothetical protein